MKLDIQTLAFISCLTFLTQFIALLVQYILNRTYRGVSWWLLGSALWALGTIFMPMVSIKSLEILARIANPLTVLGQIFLYIGILRFLEKKEKRWVLISIFAAFIIFYYYFMYAVNEISGRTFAISTAFTIISMMTAARLLINKNRLISGSTNFTAIAFLIFGIFSAIRIIVVIFSPPIQDYSDQELILELTFVIPIIAGFLWTFGFIIMINQRLNADNCEEKEKLQLIFNTGPDAAMITRLTDGLIVDVNEGYLAMSGFTRSELVGHTTINTNIWQNSEDRGIFVSQMRDHGICENKEFVFQRKNGNLFTGSLSARIITIQAIPHIISVVQDITDRKRSEQLIQQLVLQLEIEKKTAELNANTDSLTGLANRRYFDGALETEFLRLKCTGSPLSLIMLDVDHFKIFNDNYGHLAGDDCLRQLGTVLKTFVRHTQDIVARYGGEEFVVILPGTDGPGAAVLAERIRKAVEALEIPHMGSGISKFVTVSLGVVTILPNNLVSAEKGVALADDALYCAKKGGRNRISVITEITA